MTDTVNAATDPRKHLRACIRGGERPQSLRRVDGFYLRFEHRLQHESALILVCLGVLTPVLAWLRWAALERGMRLSRPLPSPLLGPVLTVGTAVASALVLIGLIIG